MPDATENNVDGVEPSILVRLLKDSGNAGGAKTRSGRVILIDVPTLITNEDLVDLGAFAYEILESNKLESSPAPPAPVPAPAPNPAGFGSVVTSVNNPSNLPGQSG